MNTHADVNIPEQPVSNNRTSPGLRRFIQLLAIAAAAMALIGVTLDVFLRTGPQWQVFITLRDLFYVNSEMNVFTWYSGTLLAAIGFGFGVIWLVMGSSARPRWPFVVLALTAIIMSADEIAMLHERLEKIAAWLNLSLSWSYGWILIGVPLAILIGVVLILVARLIDPQLRKRLIIAGAIFLLGALGFEMVGSILTKVDLGLTPTALFLLHNLSVLIEESLEIAGTIIALWATLAHLRVTQTPTGVALTTVN